MMLGSVLTSDVIFLYIVSFALIFAEQKKTLNITDKIWVRNTNTNVNCTSVLFRRTREFQVFLQMRSLHESFSTLNTLVWFFTCVR